jgi:hypothetical protein
MVQIFEAYMETCTRFAHNNLPWIAAVVLGFAAASFALRALSKLPRGGSNDGV